MRFVRSRRRLYIAPILALLGLALTASVAFGATARPIEFGSTELQGGNSPHYATLVTFDATLRDSTTHAAVSTDTMQLQSSRDCRTWGVVGPATETVDAGVYVADTIPPIVAESYFRFVVPASGGFAAVASPTLKITPFNGVASWSGVAGKIGPYPKGDVSLTTIKVSKPFTACSVWGWLTYNVAPPVKGSAGVVECSADGISYHRATSSFLSAQNFFSSATLDRYQGTLHSSYGTFYRLSTTPTGADGPSVSTIVTVISPRALFVSASKAKLRAGQTQTLHGYFWPEAPVGAKTAQIELRRRNGKKWVFAGTYRVASTARAQYSSAYSYSLKIRRKGTYRYRTVTPATAYCLRTVTAYRQFTVR